MSYDERKVMRSFEIYSKLSSKGKCERDEVRHYILDDEVRGLVDRFVEQVDSTIFLAGEYAYMLPKAISSEFHISNENLKRQYFKSSLNNSSLYLMYLAIIVLFGEFYDSYSTTNPTRDFISIDGWLESLNGRIDSLGEIDREKLERLEAEYEYGWLAIVESWRQLDDIRETAKSQSGNTKSRYSFLNTVKGFLEDQELVVDLGENQVELTEKARVIVQRYYMDYDYNRGILDFIYSLEKKKGEI